MAQNHIDWTTRIKEAVEVTYDTHVPPDITFKIEENASTYNIKAHKMVMGWVSRVFNRMFLVADTNDKNAKELLIERTTGQAFQIMKDAIYNTKTIKESLGGKSVHEVFAVLDLVTRYEIPDLLLSVRDYLDNFPLTENNVLEVAEDAMHHAGTFGDEAHTLLTTCAKFLKPKFTDAQSVFEYAAENEDRKDVVFKLQVLMKNVASARCTNCQQEPCLDGETIQANQFRDGLIVTNCLRNRNWSYYSWGKASVSGPVTAKNTAIMKSIRAGEKGSIINGEHVVWYDGTPTFLFSCK